MYCAVYFALLYTLSLIIYTAYYSRCHSAFASLFNSVYNQAANQQQQNGGGQGSSNAVKPNIPSFYEFPTPIKPSPLIPSGSSADSIVNYNSNNNFNSDQISSYLSVQNYLANFLNNFQQQNFDKPLSTENKPSSTSDHKPQASSVGSILNVNQNSNTDYLSSYLSAYNQNQGTNSATNAGQQSSGDSNKPGNEPTLQTGEILGDPIPGVPLDALLSGSLDQDQVAPSVSAAGPASAEINLWAASDVVPNRELDFIYYGIPQPVEDTPDVKAAKEAFFKTYAHALAQADDDQIEQ